MKSEHKTKGWLRQECTPNSLDSWLFGIIRVSAGATDSLPRRLEGSGFDTVKSPIIHYFCWSSNLRTKRQKPPRMISVFLT